MAVLPTPGSPIKRGVVLCAARQDLNDAFDFHLTPDDRVKFFLFGLGRQIGGELIDEGGFGIRLPAPRVAVAGRQASGRRKRIRSRRGESACGSGPR